MDAIFEARCNCLFANGSLSLEGLGRISEGLSRVGVNLDAGMIARSVERVGNWVGGRVYVFDDKIVFSMNSLNAGFQSDSSDLIVPVDTISGVEAGRMMLIAKTVDCQVLGATLRFRCNGANNDLLLEAIRSVVARNPPLDPST